MKNSNLYAYPAQFVKETNGTYTVYFPDLDGCQTYDDTLEGAAIMAKEALEAFIEDLLEDGEALPSPSKFSEVPLDCEHVMIVVANVPSSLVMAA
jgi:predicted RNase H-like HicB family nuclease